MENERSGPSPNRRPRTNYSTRLGYGALTLTELTHAIESGDDWAWQAVVDRLSRNVCIALSVFRVDSHLRNDAAAETWKTLFEHLGRIRDPERLPGWIAVVATNNMRKILRRRHGTTSFGEIEHLADVSGVSDRDRVVEGEVTEMLRRAVDRLSSREQAVVRSRAYTDEPEPLAEMAQRLGIPSGSIGPTLGRGVSKLRTDPELLDFFPNAVVGCPASLNQQGATTA